ncbi:hypothetical protein [Arthrobacter cryoconiti]|uniref:Uncharacterized protein n=1 Tax=Arthrobacter cryoconiti TaxID=748907 RepID=A0ABV8QYQ5_9MICC|nr:hypothetical protein [Arthrobacter cryoconiti]MCC9068437.1 hypothetical protein [Arthrobacter cryoconiti]
MDTGRPSRAAGARIVPIGARLELAPVAGIGLAVGTGLAVVARIDPIGARLELAPALHVRGRRRARYLLAVAVIRPS